MKYAIGFILFLVASITIFSSWCVGYSMALQKAATPLIQLDYQIQVYRDSLQLWDGEKYIGSTLYTHSGIDYLILKDNDYGNSKK